MSNGELQIPFITTPGNYSKVYPEFTDEQEIIVRKQLDRYFTGTGEEILVKYQILEGFKEFSASAFAEREYVQVEVEIIIYLEGKTLNLCKSTAYYNVESMDASKKYIDRLYEKAIQLANYKCIDQF